LFSSTTKDSGGLLREGEFSSDLRAGRRVGGIYLFVLLLLFVLYFYGLTRVGLIGPDEPRYASIGRAMAATGDWITPRLWGEAWFEKPALLYWLIAVAHRLGIDGELAARLPVALLSIAFLIFFFYRMRREFGGRAALYSSAILATSAGWLVYSQVAVTDLPLAATFAAAMLLCLPWIRSGGRRGLLLAGVLLGLAVLAKGLVALVLAAPVFVMGLLPDQRRWRGLLLLMGTCALTALPWYVLCWLQNGPAFLDEFFVRHHMSRFTSPELQHVQPWWFFIPVLLGLLFPWTPVIALMFDPRAYAERRRLSLGAVVIFGFVFFSAAMNKLPGYLLPLLPFLCALAGIRLAEVRNAGWVLATSAALLCAVPVIANVLPQALASGLRRSQPEDLVSLWSAPFLAAAVFCWWLERRGRRPEAVLTLTLAVATAVFGLKFATYPLMDERVTARRLWQDIRASNAPVCAAAGLSRSLRYGLNFYAGYELPLCAPDGTPQAAAPEIRSRRR
jgi:4-amino-4-deoxy-L-arabinose transferase-like glycosyltransferase